LSLLKCGRSSVAAEFRGFSVLMSWLKYGRSSGGRAF
jgi:hypothetical protein